MLAAVNKRKRRDFKEVVELYTINYALLVFFKLLLTRVYKYTCCICIYDKKIIYDIKGQLSLFLGPVYIPVVVVVVAGRSLAGNFECIVVVVFAAVAGEFQHIEVAVGSSGYTVVAAVVESSLYWWSFVEGS